MATQGNWMTQTFLDRFVLFKPPLLMWLSGISAKLFGIASLPLRLPAILAGALICLLAFRMSRAAPWAAVLLLLSDRLFHTLARVNMTDIVLVACLALCFHSFARDTTLRSRRSFYGFAIGAALAILAKSIAGLLPFVVVGIFWLAALPECKPRIVRVLQAALVALAIVLPWPLYQLAVHYEWFLAEFVGVQLLAFGAKPPQTSQENQILFYLTRLIYTDPELALISLFALPGLAIAAWKRADPLAILLAAWLVVFSAALLIFQYRSAQYMLPLIPALAIVAASYLPALQKRTTLAILCAAFAVKASNPYAPWGLPYASGNTLPTAAALSRYCGEQRATDLIVFDPDDEFYSAVLPLPHVRYGWVDPSGATFALQPHLHWLGITESAEEFRLQSGNSIYAQRLRTWGLRDARPIGTAIVGRDISEMQQVVAARPQSDFLLPRTWLNARSIEAHDVIRASPDRVFLFSRTAGRAGPRPWSCTL